MEMPIYIVECFIFLKSWCYPKKAQRSQVQLPLVLKALKHIPSGNAVWILFYHGFVYLRMYYCLYLCFQQDKRTDWSVRRIPLGGGGRCHMWPVVVVLELELATETSWDMQPVSCSAADTPSYFSSSSSFIRHFLLHSSSPSAISLKFE